MHRLRAAPGASGVARLQPELKRDLGGEFEVKNYVTKESSHKQGVSDLIFLTYHYVASCSTPGHKPFVRVQSLYIASLVRKSDRLL